MPEERILKVEFWGGPWDGYIKEVLNPTDQLKVDQVLYDFQYRDAVTGILRFKISREVKVN